MITKNIATCIKGLRLLGDGKAQEARDLMKDCTAHDLREAITILRGSGTLGASRVPFPSCRRCCRRHRCRCRPKSRCPGGR
jgi:hypothetical protein